VKPEAKTAIHVYPTFLPEPLYGKRLDLDYCCQSVACIFRRIGLTTRLPATPGVS